MLKEKEKLLVKRCGHLKNGKIGSRHLQMGVGTFKARCSTRYKILGYLLDEVWHSTALPDRPLEARRILQEQQGRYRRQPGASYF